MVLLPSTLLISSYTNSTGNFNKRQARFRAGGYNDEKINELEGQFRNQLNEDIRRQNKEKEDREEIFINKLKIKQGHIVRNKEEPDIDFFNEPISFF